MTSRYHEVYDELEARPGRRSGRRRPKSIDWFRRWKGVRCRRRRLWPLVHRRRMQHLLQRLDRHIESGRADQVALIHDSAITGNGRKLHLSELRDEVMALAAVLRDQGIEKGDRVIIYMPMVRGGGGRHARLRAASARCIPSSSAVLPRSELATRIDDARPKLVDLGVLRSRARPHCRLQAAARRAIALPRHKPERCLILQREQLDCELSRAATSTMPTHVARRAARRKSRNACRSSRPIRSTSSTPRARPASPRASCATMAATWSRSNGRWERVRREARRDFLGRLRCRLGGRPFLHRLRPAAAWRTTILFEGKPVGTPDAGTYWRVIAEHGVVALFTAPTAFRAIKKEGSARRACRAAIDISRFRTLFLPASAPTPTPSNGRNSK